MQVYSGRLGVIKSDLLKTFKYRISADSFRGNYSFLNLEIQRSQYIRLKVTVHKCAETIQGRKLFKGGKYMRKYGISNVYDLTLLDSMIEIILLMLRSNSDTQSSDFEFPPIFCRS